MRRSESLSKLVERVSVTFDRLPIRTRLAGVSALLTFTILCAFALVVGSLTVHRIRSNFNREVAAATTNFASFLQVSVTGNQAEGFTLHVTNPPTSTGSQAPSTPRFASSVSVVACSPRVLGRPTLAEPMKQTRTAIASTRN